MTAPNFAGIGADGGPATLPLRVPGTPSYLGIATSIASQIDLMMQDGNAWELATPQLSARSGGVADFLVGGEVPIPITQGLGETTVEYKQYGIKLHIAPIVNSRGRHLDGYRNGNQQDRPERERAGLSRASSPAAPPPR